MTKYIAFDAINAEHEHFDTIEEAREWLEETFLDNQEGYHPDLGSCEIYELKEKVAYDVTDSKVNYKYENEEDIPENDKESEAWPYSDDFDEVWQHKFVKVN